MKVALLTRDLPPVRVGGVASWVDDLARALVEDGREVTVFAESRTVDGGPRPYRVVPVPGRSWARWQGSWMAAALARHGLSDSVVVAATWRLATALRGPLQPGRLLVGAHGSDITALSKAPAGLLRVARQAVFIPVSRFLADRLAALGVDGAVPLPWPLAAPPPQPPRGDHLVCVSRLVPGKGLRDAVVLAHRLGRSLTVVGEGPARPEAEAHARTLGARVDWLGRLDRPSARVELARAAAAVLLPDGPEGLGLCLLEAACAGTPVIGRASGGTPEAVGPGVLLSAGWSELTAVRRLLDDPTAGVQARAWLRSTHTPAAALAAFDAALDRMPAVR